MKESTYWITDFLSKIIILCFREKVFEYLQRLNSLKKKKKERKKITKVEYVVKESIEEPEMIRNKKVQINI